MSRRFRMNSRGTRLFKKIVQWLVVGLLAFGTIFGITKLIQYHNATTKELHPTFVSGTLDKVGDFEDSKTSIYTKNDFECGGLTITMSFNNDIEYKVAFYDYEHKFISQTETLKDSFKAEEIPDLAQYARIAISKRDGSEIKWYQILKVAHQLTVKVDKNQTRIVELDKTSKFVLNSTNDTMLNDDGTVRESVSGAYTSATILLKESNAIYCKGVVKVAMYDKNHEFIDLMELVDGINVIKNAKVYEIRFSVNSDNVDTAVLKLAKVNQ